MINDYHMLSGLQKVAILFSVVGESLAKKGKGIDLVSKELCSWFYT